MNKITTSSLLLLVIAGLSPAVASADDDAFARVVTLAGRSVAQGAQGERVLSRGERLHRGETLRTGEQASLQLLLADKTVISIGPRAEIMLATLDREAARPKVTVKLLLGRLWARVQKSLSNETSFSVATDNAVAGVRGTSLIVDKSKDKTTVQCERGVVLIDSNGSSNELLALQEANVGPDGGVQITSIDQSTFDNNRSALNSTGGLNQGNTGERLETIGGGDEGGDGGQDPTPTPLTPPVELDPQQTINSVNVRVTIEIEE